MIQSLSAVAAGIEEFETEASKKKAAQFNFFR